MFRILSIDGGGVRGIIPCVILRHLEKRLQELSGDSTSCVSDYFDLLLGTSTGGLIVCGLLIPDEPSHRPKYKSEDVLQVYLDRSKDIFYCPPWHQIVSLAGLNSSKYPSEGIESVLLDFFGEFRLSQLLKPCLIPSFDMQRWEPHFFRQHKAHLHGYDFFVRDVCRATSAAPTYFEPAHIVFASEATYPLIDGGLVANNPAMIGYSEACNLGHCDLNEIVILSLGTGTVSSSYSFDQIVDIGAASWLRPVVDIALNDFVTDYHLTQMFTSASALRNYLRVQPVITDEEKSIDNHDSAYLNRLVEIGEETTKLNEIDIDGMAKRLVGLRS